jgi:lipopolysaccharide export system permease protein
MFLTLFIVDFLFLMQFLWLYINELVGKGLTWYTILEFIGWVAVVNLPMALPLSTLLASLMTMGNLGEDNELLALKSSGISLNRILHPLYYTIAVVAVGSFFLSSDFMPYAYLKMRTMLQEIRKKSPELSIPEDIFYSGISGYNIRVAHKDQESGALIGVMVYDHTKGRGNVSVTIADTGYIKQSTDSRYVLFTLVNGVRYEEELSRNKQVNMVSYPFRRYFFREQMTAIDLGAEDSQSFEGMFKDHPGTKPLATLNRDSDSIHKIRLTTIGQFEHSNLETSSTFQYTLSRDTLNKRVKPLRISVDSVYDAATAVKKTDYLTIAESNLNRTIAYWNGEISNIQMITKKIQMVDYERNRKFTLAIACIIFFFIGAPLGAIIRKGGLGLPVVISIFFFVVYWVIDTIFRKMVQNGDWFPFVGAWFPSLIFAPVAVFLTYKANTDSQLFNPDAYKRFFNLLLGRMKQLITPIDLDRIEPLSLDSRHDALAANPANVARLETLIDRYLTTNKNRRDILKMSSDADLLEIKTLYDDMLRLYASIDDDERVRGLIKTLPQLATDEYRPPAFLTGTGTAVKILSVPALFIMKIRKFKKLEYILNEIKDINLNINKYLNDRNKT